MRIAVRVKGRKKEIVLWTLVTVYEVGFRRSSWEACGAFTLPGLATKGLGRTHAVPVMLRFAFPPYISVAFLLSSSTDVGRNKDRDRGLSRFDHDRDRRGDG